jgi:hypothetical protein
MKKIRQVVPLAVALALAACGRSSSDDSSSMAPASSIPGALRGTYVPAGGSAAAQFARLSFDDATHYSATRASCTASCDAQGTYTFDGFDALTLEDGATGHSEKLDFQPTKLSTDGSALHSLVPLGGVLGDAGGGLVTSGGSLLVQVVEGLLNGIRMVLEGRSSSTSDAGASDAPPKSDVDVPGAIAELQAQLGSAPLAGYYADGTRVEGCWANPVGSDLSDIQKAFYCSMPLELRLCNSLVLLATRSSKDVATRWSGYVQCQQRVDAIAGGSGAFLYDAKVNASYYWLMLENDSELSAADEASVARSVKPASSGRSFSTLLGIITTAATEEAADAAFNGLQPLLDEAESAATAAGANIAYAPVRARLESAHGASAVSVSAPASRCGKAG